MTLAITAAIIAALAAFSQQRPQPNAAPGTPTGIPNEDKTFDYVIIGGGTAGLAVAARLVEGSQNSVAVVEAGGHYEQDNGNLSVVPGYCTFFAGTAPDDFNPLVDWGLVTEPQKVPFSPRVALRSMLTEFRRVPTTDACTIRVVKLSVVPRLETSCTITGESILFES